MTQPRPVSVWIIINPIAGVARGRATVDEKRTLAHEVCAAHGVSSRVEVTDRPGHATDIARLAVAEGADLVLAWGGDGTMNEVATALVGSTVPLGLVPAGSGNGLARELGIDRDPATAIAQAVTGVERRIDAGRIDGHYFFNLAGIGLDAAIARRFNERHTSTRGFIRYLIAGVIELATYRPGRYDVVVGGRQDTGPAIFVALANGRQYGNEVTVAPTAQLDDGAIDAVIIKPSHFLSHCWRARRLFSGRLLEDPMVALLRGPEVCVEGDAPLWFHYDGETALGSARLVATVLPNALGVRVPKAAPSA